MTLALLSGQEDIMKLLMSIVVLSLAMPLTAFAGGGSMVDCSNSTVQRHSASAASAKSSSSTTSKSGSTRTNR